jgi:hypothetical protein
MWKWKSPKPSPSKQNIPKSEYQLLELILISSHLADKYHHFYRSVSKSNFCLTFSHQFLSFREFCKLSTDDFPNYRTFFLFFDIDPNFLTLHIFQILTRQVFLPCCFSSLFLPSTLFPQENEPISFIKFVFTIWYLCLLTYQDLFLTSPLPPPPHPSELTPSLRTFSIFSNPKSQTIHLDRLIFVCSKIYRIPNLIQYQSPPHPCPPTSPVPFSSIPSSANNFHAVSKIISEFQKICFETNQMEINFQHFYQVLHHHGSFLLPIFELQRKMRKKVLPLFFLSSFSLLFVSLPLVFSEELSLLSDSGLW